VVRTAGAFHPAHVTTRMCLDLLDDQLQTHACKTLLDVGCGSGVLALTGAVLEWVPASDWIIIDIGR